MNYLPVSKEAGFLCVTMISNPMPAVLALDQPFGVIFILLALLAIRLRPKLELVPWLGLVGVGLSLIGH